MVSQLPRDRHKEGDHTVADPIGDGAGTGNVLFMDSHVDIVETPYPNNSLGSYNMQDP